MNTRVTIPHIHSTLLHTTHTFTISHAAQPLQNTSHGSYTPWFMYMNYIRGSYTHSANTAPHTHMQQTPCMPPARHKHSTHHVPHRNSDMPHTTKACHSMHTPPLSQSPRNTSRARHKHTGQPPTTSPVAAPPQTSHTSHTPHTCRILTPTPHTAHTRHIHHTCHHQPHSTLTTVLISLKAHITSDTTAHTTTRKLRVHTRNAADPECRQPTHTTLVHIGSKGHTLDMWSTLTLHTRYHTYTLSPAAPLVYHGVHIINTHLDAQSTHTFHTHTPVHTHVSTHAHCESLLTQHP